MFDLSRVFWPKGLKIWSRDVVNMQQKRKQGSPHIWNTFINFITASQSRSSPVTFQNVLTLEGVARRRRAQHDEPVQTGNKMSSKTEADCAGTTDVPRTQDAPAARPPSESTSAVDWIGLDCRPHARFKNAANVSHHISTTCFLLLSQNLGNQIPHMATHKSTKPTTPGSTECVTLVLTGGDFFF